MAKLIAQAYGSALYELAVEENKVAALLEEVKSLKEAFTADSEFISFMKHPQVSKDEKQKVVEDAFRGKLSDDMVGLMLTMVEKDRFSEIVSVFDYFIDAVNELLGIGNARVSTPAALSDSQKEKIKTKLLETTDYKEMNIDYDVDSSLIGGMVIRIGDRVVDSSIKTRLYEMKKELTGILL